MLTRLFVKDFVIVATQELHFSEGFAVFTGETGAGKSILVDALTVLLGGRASADIVRAGAKQAEVAAEFEVNTKAQAWLSEYSLDISEDAGINSASTNSTIDSIVSTLLLRRTVDSQGKSRAYINGSPVTVSQLKDLGELLVDIFGQHAHQSLMRKSAVRALLDDYAQATREAQACEQAYRAWQTHVKAFDEAQQAQATLVKERDRLGFELEELNKLNPKTGEWEELSTTHQRMSHSAELLQTTQDAAAELTEADDAISTRLSAVLQKLKQAAAIDNTLADTVQTLESAELQLADASHTLAHYADGLDIDAQTLADADARMSLWMSAARRHRTPPSDMAALHNAKRDELTALEAQQDLEALAATRDAAFTQWQTAAAALSRKRKTAAPKLSRAVTQAMQTLGMSGGQFEASLNAAAEPSASGAEEVEFLLAGHAGTTPKPIAKVASGGELSRIALAIAVTTSAKAAVPTLIFDEVDAGIGGTTAESVGRLMRTLALSADKAQVLCVTHLAQVAAFAHQHFCVSKAPQGKVISSEARALTGEERITEISRMLGASETNASALKSAKALASQLLQNAAHVD
jgi:DNA repair protein RecN (Recombination protein N)